MSFSPFFYGSLGIHPQTLGRALPFSGLSGDTILIIRTSFWDSGEHDYPVIYSFAVPLCSRSATKSQHLKRHHIPHPF